MFRTHAKLNDPKLDELPTTSTPTPRTLLIRLNPRLTPPQACTNRSFSSPAPTRTDLHVLQGPHALFNVPSTPSNYDRHRHDIRSTPTYTDHLLLWAKHLPKLIIASPTTANDDYNPPHDQTHQPTFYPLCKHRLVSPLTPTS